ncbi:MAG: sodium:calcium antiporter [Candidatus Dormibacteria bacterium]
MDIGLAFGGGLVLMLVAAALFTNAIEWGARSLGLGHGVTGSVLAAIGTAMPESIVPVVALIAGGRESAQTATGAILGAPLMLATIGLGLVGAVGLACGRRYLRVEVAPARRVLYAFLLSFCLLIAGAYLPRPLRFVDAAVLVGLYILFVRRTVRGDQPLEGDYEPLYFARLGAPGWTAEGRGRLLLPSFQALVGLAGLTAASDIFLIGLHQISGLARLTPLVLALLLVPIATELPELAAGSLWIRRNRDQLALGNVTGSMAFQATVPAVVGLCFTPWRLSTAGLLAALVTGVGVVVGLAAASKRGVNTRVLCVAGFGLYAIYAVVVVVLRV